MNIKEVLLKCDMEGYWALTDEEKLLVNKRWKRLHPRPKYPKGGNSETIMRNRILRAESFGLSRNNNY
jgi:hypothetical protein